MKVMAIRPYHKLFPWMQKYGTFEGENQCYVNAETTVNVASDSMQDIKTE